MKARVKAGQCGYSGRMQKGQLHARSRICHRECSRAGAWAGTWAIGGSACISHGQGFGLSHGSWAWACAPLLRFSPSLPGDNLTHFSLSHYNITRTRQSDTVTSLLKVVKDKLPGRDMRKSDSEALIPCELTRLVLIQIRRD